MSRQSFWEMIAVLVLAAMFLVFALPALFYARADIRDDGRKNDIAQLKHALEQYNNKANNYIATPDGQPGCINSKAIKAPAITSDYRYCVTQVTGKQITGYYLEAQLENHQADYIGFDEDEDRKYAFRILNENGHTLYRVCGGEEKQCGTGSSS